MRPSDEQLDNIEKMLIYLKEVAEVKETRLDLIHRDLKKCHRTLGEMCREMRIKRRYEEDSDDSEDD